MAKVKNTRAASAVTRMSSRSLFHYTSANGLIGILSTQSLFATHFDFLNDTSECRLLAKILTPQLFEEFYKLAALLLEAELMTELEAESFGMGLSREFDSPIFQSVIRMLNDTTPIYITSFCTHSIGTPDYANGRLSQWRGYAEGGFAIEFDESGLREIIQTEVKTYRYVNIITGQVWYDDHEEKAGLTRFRGIVAAALKSGLVRRHGKGVNKALGNLRLADFLDHFVDTMPFLKESGFREENEYRMVALAYRRRTKGLKSRLPRDVKFRSNENGAVVPYIAVFGETKLKLPIKSILIGPHPNQDNQYAAVELLLDRYNIKANVRRSALSLRQ